MPTMKAVRLHEYGGPEVLRYEDAPRPEPAEGEALVRIYASGVNPVDWMARAGMLQKYVPYSLPLIPGWDVSGVVEALGPGARGVQVGDDVYTRPDTRRNGSYAEYIVVKAGDLALTPPSLDRVHAAAVPLAGLTAWQALFEPDMMNLAAGDTVLIHAASGGVGSFAVQFAAWKQAVVIATGRGENELFLKELGADQVIDYTKERFEDVVHGVDAVLDLIGGETQKRSWSVLRPGGILVTTVGLSSEPAEARSARGAAVDTTTRTEQLDAIGKLIEESVVRPAVTQILPLSQARRAHEVGQGGHVRGKIVLEVAG
jgi:NADPH:quinone reductase-like Zn-dependent oxidoreductase